MTSKKLVKICLILMLTLGSNFVFASSPKEMTWVGVGQKIEIPFDENKIR